jgi:hypothetical protein
MPLLPEDSQYLTDRGITFEVHEEAGMTCLLLPSWPLPEGLSAETADVLLRLSPGYPDIPPDMWWANPPLRRADGGEIPATQVTEQHLGRSWQRWSRHFNAGQWQPGIDRLSGFLALMANEFRAATGRAA